MDGGCCNRGWSRSPDTARFSGTTTTHSTQHDIDSTFIPILCEAQRVAQDILPLRRATAHVCGPMPISIIGKGRTASITTHYSFLASTWRVTRRTIFHSLLPLRCLCITIIVILRPVQQCHENGVEVVCYYSTSL